MPKYLIVSESTNDQDAAAQAQAASAVGYVRGVPPRYSQLSIGDLIVEPDPPTPSERQAEATAQAQRVADQAEGSRLLEVGLTNWGQLSEAQRWALMAQLVAHVRRLERRMQDAHLLG